MITADEKVIRKRMPGVTRDLVMAQSQLFLRGVTSVRFGNAYLKPAQYLYDVLVRPLEASLDKVEIGNLTYIMDDGLRTLPLAALHDGKQFLIEKYSVGLMPSFSLTNTSGYVEPKSNLLLAMGASEFVDPNQNPLPAAPLEIQIIAKDIWQGDSLTENQFTVDNLVEARQKKPYGILHLATHGEFKAGDPADSYIQFEDEKVTLDQLDRLQLGKPPLELLVLSACRTAIGDRNAELGFAGLALNSGAKSALGSIWYVSDTGTMGLMTRFYQELQNAPTKAEALRQAQLALLHGEVYLEGNTLITKDGRIELPGDFANGGRIDLTHPFFWSAFALVGNPW